MAKYCTNCGKPLKEGKPCDCKSKEQNNIKIYIEKTIELFKDMITKPGTYLKKQIKDDNYKMGIIALSINIIVMVILTVLVVKELMVGVNQLFGFKSYSSFGLDIPYMKVILKSLTIYIINIIILITTLYLVSEKLLKGKVSLKKMICLVGASSIIPTITILLSILFIFISYKITIILLIFGLIMYILNLYQGLKDNSEIEINKIAYYLSLVFLFTHFITIYFLPKIFM